MKELRLLLIGILFGTLSCASPARNHAPVAKKPRTTGAVKPKNRSATKEACRACQRKYEACEEKNSRRHDECIAREEARARKLCEKKRAPGEFWFSGEVGGKVFMCDAKCLKWKGNILTRGPGDCVEEAGVYEALCLKGEPKDIVDNCIDEWRMGDPASTASVGVEHGVTAQYVVQTEARIGYERLCGLLDGTRVNVDASKLPPEFRPISCESCVDVCE